MLEKEQKQLVDNIRLGTDFIDWMRELEIEYDGKMFRDGLGIDDLVRMASNPSSIELELETEDDYKCVCSF